MGRNKIKGDETIRQFKEDCDGVAAVIGTIMGLMVFLAFISIFIMYWVPIMMEDNEETHMRQAFGQFNKLKETIDEQISSDNRIETKDTSIDLGADGVPMFERETQGQLSLRLSSGFFNLTFEDNGEDIYENSSGSIDLAVYNRFYVRQTLVYENGAVLISQSRGEIVNNEPEFHVVKEGDNTKLTLTLISLYHDSDDSIAGARSEKVSTHLWYTDRWIYSNITSTNSRVTLNVYTRYANAWNDYYDDTLSNAGLAAGSDYNITQSGNTLQIIIDRVSELSLSHAFLEAFIGRAA